MAMDESTINRVEKVYYTIIQIAKSPGGRDALGMDFVIIV